MKRALLVALTAALVAAAPAAAFTPADPLAANQWYLTQDHAFDAWPTPPPTLAPVKVAIVDSGIDNTLPDFAGQIADARSFVGGSPFVDTEAATAPSSPARSRRSWTRPESSAWRTRRSCSWRRS